MCKKLDEQRNTTVIILRLNLAMGTLINMSQVKVKVD
jgi:hypothetical protein